MVTSKALSLFDNFNQLTPYAVGYDRFFDQLQKYVQNNVQSSGFPPYNIQKGGDYTYTIEIALAGFRRVMKGHRIEKRMIEMGSLIDRGIMEKAGTIS